MKYIVVWAFGALTTAVYAQPPDLESMIRSEFDEVKAISREPDAFLEIEDSDKSSRSVIGGRVIINKRQVANTIREINASYQDYVVQLFVAHEIAHQVLYRHFGKSQSILLNECQSDILAGFFIFQLLGKEYFQAVDQYGQADFLSLLKKARDPLNAIFALGDKFTKEHTHPRDEQRRTAFRDGFAYGVLWLTTSMNMDTNIPISKKADLRTAERTLRTLLDYRPGENAVTWSLKRAKKIIHDELPACKNIVAITEFKWHTTAEDPNVYYSHFLKNIGNEAVSIDFDDQVFTALRTDPQNTLYWDLYNTQSYQYYLKPGDTRQVEGKLEWTATKEYMPYFVSLGSNGAIYSCSSNSPATASSATTKSYGTAASEAPKLSTQSALGILYSERRKFESYINSIGETSDEKESIEDVAYESKLQIPDAISTMVQYSIPTKKYSMRIRLYKGTSAGEASVKASKLIAMLKEEIPQVQVMEDDEPGEDSRIWWIERNGENTGMINLRTSKRSGSHSLTLTFYQPD